MDLLREANLGIFGPQSKKITLFLMETKDKGSHNLVHKSIPLDSKIFAMYSSLLDKLVTYVRSRDQGFRIVMQIREAKTKKDQFVEESKEDSESVPEVQGFSTDL